MAVILSINQLVVTYPRGNTHIKVLDGLNLTINKGEFLSIVGPSGCGKTTFLQALHALVKPSAGLVSCPAGSMAMVFQKPHLLPWRTVIDNALFGVECKARVTREIRHQAVTLLQRMRLGDNINDYPHQLSEGMKQRVNLARALLVKPDILLLDEPFSALDLITRNQLQHDLIALWQELGFTVVMVSHSFEEVVNLSDRIAVFTDKPVSEISLVEIDMIRPRDRDAETKLAVLLEVERLTRLFHQGEERISAGRSLETIEE